jgi:hypothetical protein
LEEKLRYQIVQLSIYNHAQSVSIWSLILGIWAVKWSMEMLGPKVLFISAMKKSGLQRCLSWKQRESFSRYDQLFNEKEP